MIIMFETLKKYCRIVGYLKPELEERFHWFPIHILQLILVYFGLFFASIPIIGLVIFEPVNFTQIVFACTMSIAQFLLVCVFSIILWIKSEIMALINDLEDIIRQSE